MRSNTSRPGFFGRFRSTMARSGQRAASASMARMNSIAFSPSAITINSPSKPCSSRARRTKPASAGLSSARKTTTGGWLGAVSPSFAARDCKEKRRTPAELGFHPYAPSGAFDNSMANGEAHAGAGIVGGTVEALEEFKNLLLVLGVYADAVVPDGKQPFLVPLLRRHMNPGRLAASVADRVADQVLKNLFQLKLVHAHAGKSGARNGGVVVFDERLKRCQRVVQHLAGFDIFGRLLPRA